ncbi:hypothetical protein V8B97DRAFT_2065774 [Scleroderma yunnanense]
MSLNALDKALLDSQMQSMGTKECRCDVQKTCRRDAGGIIPRCPPWTEAVMNAASKLVCSYPGPTITIPNNVFGDAVFHAKLANFLIMIDINVLAPAMTCKAGSEVFEERDTAHPHYITELLTGILCAVGWPADTKRISKCIGDDMVWNNLKLPWHQSSLWLVIRVTIQTTLDHDGLGQSLYKTFMLFFMNGIAGKAWLYDMSNNVLQWASAKLSHQLTKLGVKAPEWLSEDVLKTCTSIRTLFNERWQQVQADEATSPTWNPSTLDFLADTLLALLIQAKKLPKRHFG